jgi:hypothetical protein
MLSVKIFQVNSVSGKLYSIIGNWNEKTYKSTIEGKLRIYVANIEYHLTPDEISNLRRFRSTIKPERPTTSEAMKSSRCPKCGGWCYGDCSS